MNVLNLFLYQIQDKRRFKQLDTKFSVALHILAMISESRDILSSQALAESVGTNPSYIRKVIALLKKAEIIRSQQGKSGYELTKSPKEMNLLEIYFANSSKHESKLSSWKSYWSSNFSNFFKRGGSFRTRVTIKNITRCDR